LRLNKHVGSGCATVRLAKFSDTTQQDIEDALPTLVDFQCLQYEYSDGQEKYGLNGEITLLTKSLAQTFKS
jgi:hypothetical protein